jgi:hypothetical protein
MSTLTKKELMVVRQYYAPHIRLEIDAHLRTGLPLNEPLVELLRKKLAQHKEHVNARNTGPRELRRPV